MPIKYRYALNEDQQVVDVEDLTEADRKDYECIACGHVLRPVMGKMRRKHFRHQADVECSGETYLHRLGKLVFRQVYGRCLDSGEPFYIELGRRQRYCIVCENRGPCAIGPETAAYDLTSYFPKIVLETPDDGFTPDLMLSSDGGEKLYVEIAVTHRSTEAKRESGLRIIELTVKEEADLDVIKTCQFRVSHPRIEFIGFKTGPRRGDFSFLCAQTEWVFYLWHSGEAAIERTTVGELRQNYHDPDKQFYFILLSHRFDKESAYIEACERAYLRGWKVTDCYLCEHRTGADRGSSWEIDTPVFCKMSGEICSSNHAAECEYYRPDESVFRAHHDGEIKDTWCEQRPFSRSRGMAALARREEEV